MGAMEALYVYDSQNVVILQHTWRHRASLTPQELLNTYQSYAAPRPPLIYLSHLSPPTLLFSIIHNNLTFLSPVTSEIEPLLVLEFLHRVVDVLEDYFGSPLVPTKIEGNYDLVAELLGEMCDDGLMFNTEPNGLRDVVLIPSLMKKLLGSMSLPGNSLDPFGQKSQTISTIPWRRANVKHTQNEMYLDIIESLHCTVAPSGRPLAARVNGTMAFTSKISGIPDMLLTLKTPSSRGMGGVGLEAPVFHPCVRLSRWKERPGELSFVPPDGKFILSSYEMNLLSNNSGTSAQTFQLPITLSLRTLLGSSFTEFEAKLSIPSSSPYFSNQAAPSASPGFRIGGQSAAGGALAGAFSAGQTGTSNNPTMEEISIVIPLPPSVKTVLSVKISKGQFFHDMDGKNQILWRLPSLASGSIGPGSVHTLRAEIVPRETVSEEDDDEEEEEDVSNFDNSYDTSTSSKRRAKLSTTSQNDKFKPSLAVMSSMPRSAQLSFTLRGALLSGLKVDSLQIVGGKGLGEGVKPYKGVKYITRAGDGSVEIRC